MKEIVEMNRQLVTDLGAKWFKEPLVLSRTGQQSSAFRLLPDDWQVKIEELRSAISAAIPNDFSYSLMFGPDDGDLMIEFEDGPQVAAFGGYSWSPKESIIEQLKAYDWDARRERDIAMCQQYDAMIAATPNLPSNLPTTKQLQRVFRDEMHKFVKLQRKDGSKTHVLLYREDNGANDEWGFKEEHFENLEAFARDLYNIMTVQYWVITVVTDARPLPVPKIDELKKRALKELEDMPISHAKALGKL